MKKILLFILFSTGFVFAQSSSKYLIYFKDKGISENEQLAKNSKEYSNAVASLSERSIERRKKKLGNNFITFEDLPVHQKYINELEKFGVKIIWKLKWFNAVSAMLNTEQFNQIIKLSFVEKVEPVIKIKTSKDKTEENNLGKANNTKSTKYKLDYGPSLTQNELSDIPLIHDYGFSGQNVLVGIMDAGFAWQGHSALNSRTVIAEKDFVNGDENTDDGDASHGTAVFSLIGGFAEGNIIGPAYSAQFAIAKTEYIYTETHTEEDNYAAALEWMDSLGVDITTTSLGYSTFDKGEGDYAYSDMDGKTTIVTKASEIAFSKGILTVTSAGNEGNGSWKYITAPGDGFNTITVGAVDFARELAGFSSVGPTYDGRIKPEVVAQGVTCYHARAYANDYGYGGGTSYSGPIVAGIVAQLLSAYPHLTNTQLRSIVIEAADSTENPNNQFGYGLLSAKSALEFPNIKLPNPNLGEQVSSIHKLFIDDIGVLTDSVFMLFTVNSQESLHRQKMSLNQNGTHFAPLYNSVGDTIRFWFEYLNLNQTKVRFPAEDNYITINGRTVVKLGSEFGDNPIPERFDLSQNYPNPFNPETKLTLFVPEENFITLTIYNILGQKVKTLASKHFKVGSYNFTWNGSNDFGGKVSTGVYLYSAVSKSNIITKKMMYIK